MFDYKALTDYFDEQGKSNAVKLEKLKIAIVGAGGKTSTMYALGKYFAERGARVVLTTTTKVFEPEADQARYVFYSDGLENNMTRAGRVTFLGKCCGENGKVTGFEPFEAESWNSDYYDVLVYEADGAKRKPIKAPREDEPRILRETSHVIGVVGLDALGLPASDLVVHRLEQFTDVTGCDEGKTITSEHVKKLVLSDAGLFKDTPMSARKILLLTKMDDEKRSLSAEYIKQVLLDWNGTVLAI